MTMHRLLAVGVLATSAVFVMAPAAAAAGDYASHAEEECAHILEEGGTIDDCQEAPHPLLPEPAELIWGGLSFLVVAFVLGKFAWPALKKGMAAREEKIRDDLEATESARTDAETVKAEYEAKLADARLEAGRIIEEARQAADEVRRELLAQAESDAAEVRRRAQEDIDLMTERAMRDLRGNVATLSVELAEKVVEHNLDADTQRELIDSYIDRVGSN
jgi:F-type H+-transporting ATPase subunit b